MKFNPGQLAAIRAETNSVVLAGAGCGKTTVLAERYLFLVEEKGVGVDQLLCLTFTKKAAAEMYERIYARLQQSSSPAARRQLEKFDAAQISTIDSFSTQIVKNWAEHFGLSEDFAFEETSELAEEAALNFMIEHADHPALQRLSEVLGFECVWQELLAALADEYFNLAEEYDFSAMFSRQLELLREKLSEQLHIFTSCRENILRLEADKYKSIITCQEVLRQWPEFSLPVAEADYGPLLAALESLKLRKASGKALELQLLGENIDALRAGSEILVSILDTLVHNEIIMQAAGLLGDFQREYNEQKRSRNQVNFSDVARMAVYCLEHNRSLRRFYKEKFRYIMIDEFQDNNRLQKQLLFLLAEKAGLALERIPEVGELEADKLFFVGDDKQSIYRFRGAEVQVFKELNRELAGGQQEPLNLEVNYRSHPGLISFFNSFFESLLAGSSQPFAADFRPLAPRQGEDGPRPEVVLLYKPYEKDALETGYSNDESEAYAVASFIQESVAQKRFMLPAAGGLRPAEYADFTILMRSTSNQIIYERMFRLLNIPFTSQSVRSLFLEAPVNDIYNLLQLAAYPEDRIAYAAYLRSPFAALSDEALVDILQLRQPPFAAGVLLSGQDTGRWEQAAALYAEISRRLAASSLYELVSYIWYQAGYRYYILKNGKFHNFLEYFQYLVTLAGDFDERGRSLTEFLDFLRRNLGKYEKLADLDILKHASPGVQMMSIHKSKGLEFEIVVLAGCGNKGRGRGGKVPYWISEEYGLTLNLGQKNWFQNLAQQEEEEMEEAELKRLLYVALTRARSHLVLAGVHNGQNLNSSRVHLNMLLNHYNFFSKGDCLPDEQVSVSTRTIYALTEDEYNRRRRGEQGVDFQEIRARYKEAGLIAREYRQMVFSVREVQEWASGGGLESGPELSLPELPVDKWLTHAEQRRKFGILVHACIAEQLESGSAILQLTPELQVAFPPGGWEPVLAAARELTAGFLAGPWGMMARGAAEKEIEFPFLYKYLHQGEEYYIRGVLDLFFVTEGCGYVLDFKTDRQLAREQYLLQLGLYRLAACELTEFPVRCLLIPLRGGEPLDVTPDLEGDYALRHLAAFCGAGKDALDAATKDLVRFRI